MTDSRRVLLKVSGEWFSGDKEKGFDERQIKSVKCPIGRNLKMNNKKMPEVIAALAISDILESFDK